MSISDDLARLADLHQRGMLSDDEFNRAKARVLSGNTAAQPSWSTPAVNALNQYRRSATDRWAGGVCGGLAVSTGVAAWAWRLAFVLLAMCAGTGVLLYALLWLLVPLAPATWQSA